MRYLVPIALFALSATASEPSPVHVRIVSDTDFTDAQPPQLIEQNVAEIQQRLARPGRLAMPQTQQQATADLSWPLQPIAGFDQFDYHGTSNFVDHGPPYPGAVQDYTCGSRTYNIPGYNHAGTDYYLWPFAWAMMDAGQVRIVAAAPGTIVRKDDGNFDRDCAFGNSSPNAVYVLQDDGLTAIYLHMRKGSVTAQTVGSRVAAGDYLGLVGSSGSSTAPHLHFELRDAGGNVVDPRHGQCNAAPDRWTVFQAYEDPHIDSLSTHSAEPEFVACGVDDSGNPVAESPHFHDEFTPGSTLWVFASYRDQRNGEITNFRIARPDGSTFAAWDFDLASQHNPKPFYSGTAADWSFALPADAPAGVWSVTAAFEGQTYARTFRVSAGVQAGTSIGGYLSGNWYDPSQAGHGFQIEVAQGNVMLAIWFVYPPDGGGQSWIYAQGTYDATKNTVTLPAVVFSGAKFPPNFVAADVASVPWGTLTFTFSDCNTGVVTWNSTVPGYGTGTLPIQRLTQIAGTTCPP